MNKRKSERTSTGTKTTPAERNIPPVLQIDDLSIHTRADSSGKRLVRNLNLTIQPGEMVALIGESGSGKSVTASAVTGLLPAPLSMSGGRILFQGRDTATLTSPERRAMLGKEISVVFQDYAGSFTPFIKIGKQLIEMIRRHMGWNKTTARVLATQALEQVELAAERVMDSYLFQLSGGQQQRVAIAAALMLEPDLLIADEPTTALDTLTGETILQLIDSLRHKTKCAVLFISHDLHHVIKRADRIAVMYGGEIVESGPTDVLVREARHPYTRFLLQSRMDLADVPARLQSIPGEPGAVSACGCPFALRCPVRIARCDSEAVPEMMVSDGHTARCHLIGEAQGDLGAAEITRTS
ncbi:ABC transporter ATP-binding protein [Brevibacillus dissolubilis]|uniref:ABC transporter ATP-binding protein n=1 Tax=Brevibacillus dissolubilis TaxID=1844116 RepID=UPI0011174795|nr:ABC transporter ATP-binding protein [Brevibacillus dissolubilis]